MHTIFTDLEIATLLENEWEADEDGGYAYLKRRSVLLGCGCCSETETIYVYKAENGTYQVSYYPHQGGSEHHDTPSLAEAIDWF